MRLSLTLFFLVIIICSPVLNGQFRATVEVYNYMIDRYSQNIGKIAPNCQLMDTNGRIYNLHDFKHKLVILDFWGTWCGHCIADMPITHGIYNRLKSNGYSDIEWINISTDSDTTKWKNMVLKGNDGFYYPSQVYKDWDKLYTNIYDIDK